MLVPSGAAFLVFEGLASPLADLTEAFVPVASAFGRATASEREPPINKQRTQTRVILIVNNCTHLDGKSNLRQYPAAKCVPMADGRQIAIHGDPLHLGASLMWR